MQPWQRKKGLMKAAKFSTVFDPMEREVLGNMASSVSEALMERARSAPKDEFAEMMGLNPGHTEAPEDPSLARLLPDFERAEDEAYEGDNQMMRSLYETDIIKAKLANLQVVSEALGPMGGVHVTLTQPEAHQFIAALNDLRLYLAATEPRSSQNEEDRDNLVEWLAYCQDSLLQALMGD